MQSLDKEVQNISIRAIQRLKGVSMQSLSLENVKQQYYIVAYIIYKNVCKYPNRLEELIFLILLWNRYCEKVKLENNPSYDFFMFYVLILICSDP